MSAYEVRRYYAVLAKALDYYAQRLEIIKEDANPPKESKEYRFGKNAIDLLEAEFAPRVEKARDIAFAIDNGMRLDDLSGLRERRESEQDLIAYSLALYRHDLERLLEKAKTVSTTAERKSPLQEELSLIEPAAKYFQVALPTIQ